MIDVGGASRDRVAGDGLGRGQGFDLSGELCKIGEVDPEVTESLKDIGKVWLCTIGCRCKIKNEIQAVINRTFDPSKLCYGVKVTYNHEIVAEILVKLVSYMNLHSPTVNPMLVN